jgi:type I restriction enzyme S subunit
VSHPDSSTDPRSGYKEWPAVRLRYLGRLKGGAGFPDAEQGVQGEELPFFKVKHLAEAAPDGGLESSEHTISRETAEQLGAFVFPSGSIVFAKIGAALLLNRFRYVRQPSCIDNNMMGFVLDESKAVRRFMLHSMGLLDFSLIENPGAVPSLSTEKIGEQTVAIPSLRQQSAIADFLDDETVRIDELIAAKENLLAILAEKRRALVWQAVTRGLDPNVKMRDSGVPWLGEIPEHWKVCHLKRVLAASDYGISTAVETTGAVGILRMGDINDGAVDYSRLGYVDDVPPELLLQPGDLLFNRTNSLEQIGKVGMVREDCPDKLSFASYLVRLRFRLIADPTYFNWLLNSAYAIGWCRSEAIPAIGQANLNPSRYGYFPIPLPPLHEQCEINAALRMETTRIVEMTTSARRTIDLLRERREAVIAAAVTGQFDVEVA